MMSEEQVAVIVKFFAKPGVAALEVTSGTIKNGDLLRYKGHTTDFTEEVVSMELDNQAVDEAKPGDVLAAVRTYAIEEYAQPKVLARALKDPKKLPILMAIPAILFLVVGSITGLLDFTPDLSEGISTTSFSPPGWSTCICCRRPSLQRPFLPWVSNASWAIFIRMRWQRAKPKKKPSKSSDLR